MLSPTSFGQEEELSNEEEELLVWKLMMGAYRNAAYNEDGDDLIKIFPNLEYFYCEGSGASEIFAEGTLDREIVNSRKEFIFVFQDVNKDKEQSGLFAVSSPAELGLGWLVVSAKGLNDKKWKNVWDSEFSLEKGAHPLENVFKGTVNEFIMRVDIKEELEDENWQDIGNGTQTSLFSQESFMTMNRKNKNFYWFSKRELKAKTNGLIFNFIDKGQYEGDCTVFER